ncbi:MAG: 16S rRNA (cytosine(1402)-N(4))-methyltransferase [SAR202 cluster bacterium Io17-Chloro-G9]|nr:MAG: 16S rRNA (cytosine(1402)-N(4))-methyltransferase [SAR202 cluster bacterium Io17-Chloro-G9]
MAHQAEPEGDAAGFHQPVLLQEALDKLSPRDGGIYLDATVGEGGHALAMLDRSEQGGRVIGIDRDSRSMALAIQRLSQYGLRFIPAHGSYSQMAELCQVNGISQVDGILMDLGFSSRHIEAPGYGFSFQRDEPLDMRYDQRQSLTAAEIVNAYGQEELASLIFRFGEEPRSRSIAREIVRSRPVATTGELAQSVARAVTRSRGSSHRRIHPATRTFQALRIAVNSELEHLEAGLSQAIDLLTPGGNLVVISYHSLEDRMVKNAFTNEAAGCICPPGLPECVCGHEPRIHRVTRRVIKPSPEETGRNPRSRSARMRVAQRL